MKGKPTPIPQPTTLADFRRVEQSILISMLRVPDNSSFVRLSNKLKECRAKIDELEPDSKLPKRKR